VLTRSLMPMPMGLEGGCSTSARPDQMREVQRHRAVLTSGPRGMPTEFYSLLDETGMSTCLTTPLMPQTAALTKILPF
jgi:hypothetical protein